MNEFNDVNNPIHYNGDGVVQAKDAIASMLYNQPSWMSGATVYWWGCAFKYLWRWPFKGRIKDIDKAIWCLETLKNHATADLVLVAKNKWEEEMAKDD